MVCFLFDILYKFIQTTIGSRLYLSMQRYRERVIASRAIAS